VKGGGRSRLQGAGSPRKSRRTGMSLKQSRTHTKILRATRVIKVTIAGADESSPGSSVQGTEGLPVAKRLNMRK
jgi:hypothetical protein